MLTEWMHGTRDGGDASYEEEEGKLRLRSVATRVLRPVVIGLTEERAYD
jgi:hypothetical protein